MTGVSRVLIGSTSLRPPVSRSRRSSGPAWRIHSPSSEGEHHPGDGREKPLGHPQAVAVEHSLDREGGGDAQHGRSAQHPGQATEQERRPVRAVGDVAFETVEGLLSDEREQHHGHQPQHGGQEPQQVGGAADALRE